MGFSKPAYRGFVWPCTLQSGAETCYKLIVLCFLKVPRACLAEWQLKYSPNACGTRGKHFTKPFLQVSTPECSYVYQYFSLLRFQIKVPAEVTTFPGHDQVRHSEVSSQPLLLPRHLPAKCQYVSESAFWLLLEVGRLLKIGNWDYRLQFWKIGISNHFFYSFFDYFWSNCVSDYFKTWQNG